MASLVALIAVTFLVQRSLAFPVLPSFFRLPTLLCSSAGPRGEGRQRSSNPNSGPRREPRRAPPTQSIAFDGKVLTSKQSSNHDALPIDLADCPLKCAGATPMLSQTSRVPQPAFRFMSLDDVVPGLGFSETFNSCSDFRHAIRNSMRLDMFDATPQYHGLTDKAKAILLLPDSSLQGSWRTVGDNRMHRLTAVLKDGLGPNAPTGDQLMHAIGQICGSTPSTHWIDIVGVLDRTLNHAWHQDSGRSPGDSKTVLWGFPADDNYEGTGIFSHVLPLTRECIAPDDHPRMEPVLFQGSVSDDFIVKPSYGRGRELLVYRDVDVLHSSPDVAFRTSVMRFM
jgi:hypothetical protein